MPGTVRGFFLVVDTAGVLRKAFIKPILIKELKTEDSYIFFSLLINQHWRTRSGVAVNALKETCHERNLGTVINVP